MPIYFRIQEWLRNTKQKRKKFLVPGFLIVVFSLLVYGSFFAPPIAFPAGEYVRVAQGQTVADIAEDFKARGIIRSQLVFSIFSKLYGEGQIIAGEYFFPGPQSALTIVRRLTSGIFEVEPIKITVPEGTSVYGITNMLRDNVPDFDADAFYALAEEKEGRLFPDTYFIMPGEDPKAVLKMLEDNFSAQMSQGVVAVSVAAFGKSLNDVLVMASLLEKEANNSRDRRIIAGILWNRIKNDMLLQVDAVFPYLIGKNSFNITKTELQTDSPYNTYVYKGLPPGPITNPGLQAILDAVTPIHTDYVFYLSDKDGTMHYAVTYDQHLVNKRKYIGS